MAFESSVPVDKKITIYGELASKANSRMAVQGRTKTGKSYTRFVKSKKALGWTEGALPQIKSQWRSKPIDKECGIECEVYYKTRRPDLDVSLLMDALEKAGVYTNDRLVHEIIAHKQYDKEEPRVEVTIYEL